MIKYDHHAAANLAVYVILRRGNTAAFVLRSNTDWMNNHYGLPAGKVEVGESYTDAAIREAKEEVGVTIAKEDLVPVLAWQRHHDDSDWVDMFFEAKQWQGEVYNAEPHMHSEVAWLELDNLPDNVTPGIADVLPQIAAGKTYAEYGWS